MNKDAVQAELARCEKLLSEVKTKLKSRPQVSAALVSACEQTLKTLWVANANFPRDLAEGLATLAGQIIGMIFELDGRFGTNKNAARTRLLSLLKNLELRLELREDASYNPLIVPELTKSIESAFSRNAPVRLSEIKPFRGSGVYALYYTGDFPLYAPIADSNKKVPGSWAIYVGKAGKEGKRKGIDPEGKKSSKSSIYDRLADQHAESIKATSLRVEDFWVRYLPIEGLFVPLCEKMLIAQHQPLWNDVVDGFGNKHMGVARIDEKKGQQITAWDLLHPGRANRAVKPNKRFSTPGVLEEAVRKAIEKAGRERPPLAVAIKEAIEAAEEGTND